MQGRWIALLLALACTAAWADNAAAVTPSGSEQLDIERSASAQTDAIAIPNLMSYQGKLTDTMGIPVPDDNYSTRFRLYTQASGGTQYWQETQSVSTENGLFAVLLGSVVPIPHAPEAGNGRGRSSGCWMLQCQCGALVFRR